MQVQVLCRLRAAVADKLWPTVILLTLAGLVSACSPWAPSDFPVRVEVGADLDDNHRAALLDGIALLEERVGADVFTLVESNGRRIQRDRSAVRDGVKKSGYNGWYERNHWSCRITLIARLENGAAKPSLSTLERFARATGMTMRVVFEPAKASKERRSKRAA